MDLLEITDKEKMHKHFLDDGSEDENHRDPLMETNCIQYRVGGSQSEGPLYRVITTDSEGNQTTAVNTGGLTNVQAVLASPLNGQFYVIGNPTDLLGNVGQRTIAPRTAAYTLETSTTIQTGGSGGGKDDKQGTRRATHNEVERRRRDNINNWIMKLGKLIPDAAADNSQGGKHTQSKGGILAKACEYLADLRNQEARLSDSRKETEAARAINERLKVRLDQLQNENQVLRQQLQDHGIIPASSSSSSTTPPDIKFAL